MVDLLRRQFFPRQSVGDVPGRCLGNFLGELAAAQTLENVGEFRVAGKCLGFGELVGHATRRFVLPIFDADRRHPERARPFGRNGKGATATATAHAHAAAAHAVHALTTQSTRTAGGRLGAAADTTSGKAALVTATAHAAHLGQDRDAGEGVRQP